MRRHFLTSAFSLCLTAGAASADYTLHILHTNDFHSRIEPINAFDSTCSAEANAEGDCFGGIARLVTLVEQMREELAGENVILLDAGDQYQGSLVYTTYKGAVEIEFMNLIGFDAMAVGNHEFDDGPEGLAGLLDGAAFPVISGNVDVSREPVLAGRLANHVILDVGGHSHTLMSNSVEAALPYPVMVGDVPVVQAYAHGKYLGHLTLVFDDAGTVISASGDTILIDASVPEDPAAVARVAELAGPIEELRNLVVAEAAATIDGSRESCRAVECAMGNLVADAMLARVADQGITIAIQNGGGLRASIEAGEAGEVTMGGVLGVLPFQNTLSTFQVTGATVVAALENGVSDVEGGAGRFPQVAGLSFAFDPAAEPGARVTDVMVRMGEDWGPIDPEAIYGIVSNNYVRQGGDGYAMFVDAMNAYDFGPDLADVVAEYMAANAPYEPYLDGRIVVK